jgi:glutamate synthase (NADPH/NADH) small chain
MAEHLLKFVNLPKAMPDKREAGLRREDFQEIYERFRPAAASAQASRCSQCGVPFCQVHCPLNNNIPDWLKLTAEGRLEEAYEISAATNTFPEICGRICPQDALRALRHREGFDSVTIGRSRISPTPRGRGLVKPSAGPGNNPRHRRGGPGRPCGRGGAAPQRLPGDGL